MSYTSCHSCITPRMLFQRCLAPLLPNLKSNIVAFPDFVKVLKELELENDDQAIYLVFDDAEKLRSFGSTFIPTLSNLQELVQSSFQHDILINQTGKNICVILIASVPWDEIHLSIDLVKKPIMISFPAYSHDETSEILQLARPEKEDEKLYDSFVSIILDTFWRMTNDVKELHYIVQLLYPKYIEPIEEGFGMLIVLFGWGYEVVSKEETGKLLKNVEFHVRNQFSKLLLREVSRNEWKAQPTTLQMVQQPQVQKKTLGEELLLGLRELTHCRE